MYQPMLFIMRYFITSLKQAHSQLYIFLTFAKKALLILFKFVF